MGLSREFSIREIFDTGYPADMPEIYVPLLSTKVLAQEEEGVRGRGGECSPHSVLYYTDHNTDTEGRYHVDQSEYNSKFLHSTDPGRLLRCENFTAEIVGTEGRKCLDADIMSDLDHHHRVVIQYDDNSMHQVKKDIGQFQETDLEHLVRPTQGIVDNVFLRGPADVVTPQIDEIVIGRSSNRYTTCISDGLPQRRVYGLLDLPVELWFLIASFLSDATMMVHIINDTERY